MNFNKFLSYKYDILISLTIFINIITLFYINKSSREIIEQYSYNYIKIRSLVEEIRNENDDIEKFSESSLVCENDKMLGSATFVIEIVNKVNEGKSFYNEILLFDDYLNGNLNKIVTDFEEILEISKHDNNLLRFQNSLISEIRNRSIDPIIKNNFFKIGKIIQKDEYKEKLYNLNYDFLNEFFENSDISSDKKEEIISNVSKFTKIENFVKEIYDHIEKS